MPSCEKCSREHAAGCKSHRSKNHATDPGGPCGNSPMHGLAVCHAHGGMNPNAKAAGERRTAEAKAEAAVIAKLGDSGQPVTDPIATLCSIAGRAVRFMELIGQQVDTLQGRQLNEQVRAEIALYERSMGRAATVVESLIRMGIAERLAKVEEEQTAAIVKFIDGVLTDLGHNPRAPEVAGVVARRLELVS